MAEHGRSSVLGLINGNEHNDSNCFVTTYIPSSMDCNTRFCRPNRHQFYIFPYRKIFLKKQGVIVCVLQSRLNRLLFCWIDTLMTSIKIQINVFCGTTTLDEFPEFEKRVLESLREPLEPAFALRSYGGQGKKW